MASPSASPTGCWCWRSNWREGACLLARLPLRVIRGSASLAAAGTHPHACGPLIPQGWTTPCRTRGSRTARQRPCRHGAGTGQCGAPAAAGHRSTKTACHTLGINSYSRVNAALALSGCRTEAVSLAECVRCWRDKLGTPGIQHAKLGQQVAIATMLHQRTLIACAALALVAWAALPVTAQVRACACACWRCGH